MPNFIAGTAKTWAPSGGDYAWTLTSLASGSARAGAKGDFYDGTYGLPAYLDCFLSTAANVTVSADGNPFELYWAQSDSATAGTNNPAQLTGADAAASAVVRNLLDFGGTIGFLTGLTTTAHKRNFKFQPWKRYLIPFGFNNCGQALSSTAGNHLLTVTPYYWA